MDMSGKQPVKPEASQALNERRSGWLNLRRIAMSLCGALAGLSFMLIANSDYFLRYGPDKLGAKYAVASITFSFLGGWLFHNPKSWRGAIVNAAIAVAVSALIAFLTLAIHPNSVFNSYGDFDLG